MENGDTGTVKRKRGRPRKPVEEKKEVRKAGRPLGSKNKTPEEREKERAKKSPYTVSPAALAQRRTNYDKFPARTDEEREYNARLIEHTMRVNEIATHADRSDINSLKSCFIAYLQLCQEDGFGVGNIAAYASMGFFQQGSFEYFIKKDDPDIRAFGTFVKATCAMMREGKIADSKINPVIGIFWQRNFDGLRNDTEQVQAANAQDDELGASKSYKEKYKNLIGE